MGQPPGGHPEGEPRQIAGPWGKGEAEAAAERLRKVSGAEEKKEATSVEWLNPEPQLEQAEAQDAHIKPIGAKARLMTEALEPPADAAKEMQVFPRYHHTLSNG